MYVERTGSYAVYLQTAYDSPTYWDESSFFLRAMHNQQLNTAHKNKVLTASCGVELGVQAAKLSSVSKGRNWSASDDSRLPSVF